MSKCKIQWPVEVLGQKSRHLAFTGEHTLKKSVFIWTFSKVARFRTKARTNIYDWLIIQ